MAGALLAPVALAQQAPAALEGAEEEAGPQGDVLLQALSDWAQRAHQELSLQQGAAPYRTVFAAIDNRRYAARASFGELVSESGQRSRPGRVEVVVGDDQLNSSRFSGGPRVGKIVGTPSLVVEDVPLALARDLWLTADHVYKAAVVQHQVKLASLAALGGEPPPPDWTAEPPAVAVELAPIVPVDEDKLRDIALQASERLRIPEGLRNGEVQVRAWDGRFYCATSEGTRLVQPEGYAVVYAWADMLREDGVRLYDQRQWVARRSSDLPSAEEIADQVEALGRGIAARAAAEAVDYYEGPVVLEGRAAADFFRYLVPKEVCGTPPSPSADRTYQQLTRSGPRLGRRLLPTGWTVDDDPGRVLPGLAGGYVYDREGVAGQPVSLVRDGYVRDLLMSRVPRADLPRSNGHARGSVQSSWQGRLSIWEVEPARHLGSRAFTRQVVRAMKEAGLERILMVRGFKLGSAGGLPRPTDAVWLAQDGSEQPVLSLQFQKVDRRTLRDVVAAGGGQQVHAYLDSWRLSGGADGDTGLPTVLLAPQRLLVGEMEAVFPGADEKPVAYPQPGLSAR